MIQLSLPGIVQQCDRHSQRLTWALEQLRSVTPLTEASVSALSDEQVAIVDQFIFRFAKLQDAMGAQLFPAILDTTAEPGPLLTFIDKLNRLEKIGALESAQQWIQLRELRNQISHDYPDDPEYQAALLNLAFHKAELMLAILKRVKAFAARYN